MKKEKTTVETVYSITSQSREKASPGKTLKQNRGHWCIANKIHWVLEVTFDEDRSKTKVIFEKSTGRVIGAGIVGSNASELISEMALSIEMGCNAEDLSLTVHPHPTLSESISFSAEIFEGTITDLYLPKKRK